MTILSALAGGVTLKGRPRGDLGGKLLRMASFGGLAVGADVELNPVTPTNPVTSTNSVTPRYSEGSAPPT
jgi:hypothetical protein